MTLVFLIGHHCIQIVNKNRMGDDISDCIVLVLHLKPPFPRCMDIQYTLSKQIDSSS